MELPAQDRAIDHVEWLAALWELSEPGHSRCANAHLLTLLRFAPRLSSHPALEWVARLRREQSRDQLVKAVIRAEYGTAEERRGLCDALRALTQEAQDVLGAGPHRLIQQARDEARARVEHLAGSLDPAADLAAVTGERLPLRVVLAPSVFLPPPQAGRHGALVQQPTEWVAHLHFGFPLNQDPRQSGITLPWLLGGAWHYAIHIYLERYWPPIARRLDQCRELADVLDVAAGAAPGGVRRSWTDTLRLHLNVALKCLLARRLGMPDGIHRAFALALGLELFPWFEEWLLDSGAEGAALAVHIATLPETLLATRSRWEPMLHASDEHPPTINLALVSVGARRACLVLPDEWPQGAVAAAVAGWRLRPLPVVSYGEWVRTRSGDTADPVIAFGEPERNPLVRRVLEQRGLSLAAVAAADPAIIALSSPGFEQAAWCIAVAVARPETAAQLRMEMALKQTSSYVILDGKAVVDLGRVSLEELAPAAPRS